MLWDHLRQGYPVVPAWRPPRFVPGAVTYGVFAPAAVTGVYCLDGDTPVLLGDGRMWRLADVRVGDSVYGTVRVRLRRRFVRTVVLAHWQTVAPAYRVTLQDGAGIVAGGEHRFLTRRGWKPVRATTNGRSHRRQLTTSDELLGLGELYAPPEATPDYRINDITGITVRRDARYRVVSVEPLGVDLPMFDITTSTGDFIAAGVVSHNCFVDTAGLGGLA